MKLTKKANTFIFYALMFLIIIILLKQCESYKDKYNTEKDLINSLQDTLKVWKDKDSLNHAKIQVIETQKTKDFLNLQTKNEEIQKLQQLVKDNQKKLKDKGSVTYIAGKTKFDTVFITKLEYVEILGDNTIHDSISNSWITSHFGFSKDSVYFDLTVTNRYSVIIGEEKEGLFKPPRLYVEVINENPYSETTSLRTYQVSNNSKPKRFSIGPMIGAGISYNKRFIFTPVIGIGLQYSLIKF